MTQGPPERPIYDRQRDEPEFTAELRPYTESPWPAVARNLSAAAAAVIIIAAVAIALVYVIHNLHV